MPRVKTKLRGDLGEYLASDYLVQNGYEIVSKNFHSRFGEIDIVAKKGYVLYFVEVKTRSNTRFGTPVEAVTPWKISNIEKTAEYFSLLHPDLPQALRIMVVEVDISGPTPKISSINAD